MFGLLDGNYLAKKDAMGAHKMLIHQPALKLCNRSSNEWGTKHTSNPFTTRKIKRFSFGGSACESISDFALFLA